MNTVWTKETPTSGNSIVIRHNDVGWASYDLPSTSHSGGSAQVYQFDQIFEGSGFYNSVVAVFGLSVAQEILNTVENRNLIEQHNLVNDSESKIILWLGSIPEDETIPIPWKIDAQKFEFVQRDFTPLAKIGITVEKNGHHCQLFDSKNGTSLFSLSFTDAFDFALVPALGIRIICTRKEVFIIDNKHDSLLVLTPFKKWEQDWENMCSEISQPHLFSDHFLVRFNINRIRTEEGDYLLKIDFSGNVVSIREITNL